jgi:predicted DNA-binding transcriptional regulator AlpA
LGGISKTKFHDDYIKTGRLHPIPLGKRAIGFLEADIDRLIEELVTEAKANPDRRASGPNDWRDQWKSDPLETRKKKKNKKRVRRAVAS